MRKVIVSEYKKQEDGKCKLEEKGEAIFHQFGVGYKEFESGPGNYSTTIVEWDDGMIENVPVEQMKFIKQSGE